MNNFEKTNHLDKKETKRELVEFVKNLSEKMKRFELFNNLENKKLSPEDYSKFFSHKYSAVGYFTDFLKRGSDISGNLKLPHLQETFQKNFEDESGIINGKYDKEWEHETWRQKMLQLLSVKKIEENNQKYSEMIESLSKEKDVFFMSGYLTTIELFVAIEMKNLWKAMKRDLPKEWTEYNEKNIPNNPLEYIKNHADHDGDHYDEILKAVLTDMKNSFEKERCKDGMNFGYKTREVLYNHLNQVVFNSSK